MRDNSCKYDSNEINIYFTGGVTQPENYILNDLWLLSFQDVVWDEHTYELPGVTWNEIHIPNMVGLKGHSAFLIDTNHIFIFGGYNQQGQPQNDSFILNIFSNSIEKIITKGEVPPPRAYHSLINIRPNLYCLFGGIGGNENVISNNYNSNDIESIS